MIHFGRLFLSFRNAFRGIAVVVREEQSFRIQAAVGVLVVAAGFAFRVRAWEWIVLLLLIGVVLCLELLNSILERLVDALKPRLHPVAKDVKDMMAAVVFIASFLSALVGVSVFWPHVFEFVARARLGVY